MATRNACLAGTIIVVFTSPILVSANTLSMAYMTAFHEPFAFDILLRDEIRMDPDFFDKFDFCYSIAVDFLTEMCEQLMQRHRNCTNNAECTDLAKQVQNVDSIIENARNLNTFFQARRNDPTVRFLDFEIGRGAVQLDRLHQQIQIPVSKNVLLRAQLAVLSSVQCQ